MLQGFKLRYMSLLTRYVNKHTRGPSTQRFSSLWVDVSISRFPFPRCGPSGLPLLTSTCSCQCLYPGDGLKSHTRISNPQQFHARCSLVALVLQKASVLPVLVLAVGGGRFSHAPLNVFAISSPNLGSKSWLNHACRCLA